MLPLRFLQEVLPSGYSPFFPRSLEYCALKPRLREYSLQGADLIVLHDRDPLGSWSALERTLSSYQIVPGQRRKRQDPPGQYSTSDMCMRDFFGDFSLHKVSQLSALSNLTASCEVSFNSKDPVPITGLRSGQ
eukprot:IDg13748t1